MSTFLGVPITINEEVYGNLYLTEKAASASFDEEDEHLLTVLAEWAAIAIDNARSHERSRIRQQELERAVAGPRGNRRVASGNWAGKPIWAAFSNSSSSAAGL